MPDDFFTRLEDLIKNLSTDPERASAAEILRERGNPSTSIAILENGNITAHCISSVGDNTDTLFQACSISKPTAGMAVIKLAEEGLLSLDDRICDVLPENISQHLLSDPATAPVVRTITIKHLMSHTAGISQHGFPGYPDKNNIPTAEEVVTGGPLVNTMPIKLISLPGLEFMYSGGGTTLLQLITEHVTKKPFEEIMTQYVLKPLNMTRSCYTLPSDEKNVARCYYNGHLPTEVDWHVLPEKAAGGLWTTPTDLLKLIDAMQKSLDPTTANPFMSAESARTMLTPIKQHSCLSWFACDTQFGHAGGNTPAWGSYVYGHADLPWHKKTPSTSASTSANGPTPAPAPAVLDQGPPNSGIAIMTNSVPGLRPATELLHAITHLKRWPQVRSICGGIGDAPPIPAPTPLATALRAAPHWSDWLAVPWSDSWTLIARTGPHGGGGGESLPALALTLAPAPGSTDTDPTPTLTLPLCVPAIPPRRYADGRVAIDLLVRGLALMLRLDWTWEGVAAGEPRRVVEVWGAAGEHVICKGKGREIIENSE